MAKKNAIKKAKHLRVSLHDRLSEETRQQLMLLRGNLAAREAIEAEHVA